MRVKINGGGFHLPSFKAIMEDIKSSNFIVDHKLNTSTKDDIIVKRTAELIAIEKGISFDDAMKIIEDEIQAKVAKDKGLEITKSSINNAYEELAFSKLQAMDLGTLKDYVKKNFNIDSDDLLDREYFYDMCRYVIAENSSFFPLKNPFETKAVKPFFFLIPDQLPSIQDKGLAASAKSCSTAFCTPKAEMVFQRSFFEYLAIHAILKDVKPKSKKYVANGGKIPNWYCYLEFVIIHELMHFSVGDHFYTSSMSKKIAEEHPKVAGMAHQILNYVGDFVNNWNIVKAGYEQLPMGLFSDKLNLDKEKRYSDIIDKVIKELESMNPEEAKETAQEMSNSQDDHVESEGQDPSQGGQGQESQDGQGQESQDGQGTKPQDGQGQEMEGEGDPNGKPSSGSSKENTMDQLDQSAKDTAEKSKEKEDNKNNAQEVLNKTDAQSEKSQEGKLGKASNSVDLSVQNSQHINWKVLLKRLMPSGEGEMEDTYSRMDRSSSSTMLSARQTGMGRIKPGEIEGEASKRGLVFVIDTSGSVMMKVGNFMKQILVLVEKNKDLIDFMYIIKFSKDFEVLSVNLKDKTAQEFINSKDLDAISNNTFKFDSKKLKGAKIPLLKVLSTGYGSSTNMTPKLFKVIEMLHEIGGNVIMFTDDDLTYGTENLTYTKKLYHLGKSRPNSMAMFLLDNKSYDNMSKTYGKYKWVTVLE